MKRSPLKRGKPLVRKTRLRAKGKGKYARRPRDKEHMRLVRKLPCYAQLFAFGAWLLDPGPDVMAIVDKMRANVAGFSPCYGPIQADHMGRRAFGHKSKDAECVPMCKKHHDQRTDYKGLFKDFNAEEMRYFCDAAIDWAAFEVAELRALADRGSR